MLILNERVTSGFGGVRIVDDKDFFDRTIALEFTAQFGLGCVVVLKRETEFLMKVFFLLLLFHNKRAFSFEIPLLPF